jgi:Xaa-Pro aminopeptidase
MKLKDIQENVENLGGDGWLFFDIHERDKIAYKILELDGSRLTTRRWFYFIPKSGEPIKLVSKIEQNRLNELPGKTVVYVSWKDMRAKLSEMLKTTKNVFMQYSPYNNIPLISCVDAGTVELIRSFGVEVMSSANLVQLFEARIDREGFLLHEQAGIKIQKIKDLSFDFIRDSLNSGKHITECDVQAYILDLFEKENLTCDGLLPIVAINEHASDPHFEVSKDGSFQIKEGDKVMIDLWARINVPKGIYYDITWCGYVGNNPPKDYVDLFNIVMQARDAAKKFITYKMNNSETIYGWQVDDVCRGYITEKGFGEYFIHRTGHSIHTSVHGNGANMDNLEMNDEREIVAETCFSIEPGIYKEDIGVRSEINIFIDKNRRVVVVGEEQNALILI